MKFKQVGTQITRLQIAPEEGTRSTLWGAHVCIVCALDMHAVQRPQHGVDVSLVEGTIYFVLMIQ